MNDLYTALSKSKSVLPRPEPNPEPGDDLAAVLLPPDGGRGVPLFGGPALELQAAALVDD